MQPPTEMRIFSGRSNPDLSRKIAEKLEKPLGDIEIINFPDGETFVKFKQNVRGCDVFLIQPTGVTPNESLMELLITIDAAHRASAERITAVIPYFAYARQDRKDQPRVPITAKLVANLLTTAGASRVLTMDLHAGQIQGFFDIPVDHLYAAPVIENYLTSFLNTENLTVISPDTGSVKMARGYSDILGCGFAIVAKRRVSATEVTASHLVGEVKGRNCIIVDDMTTTSGTIAAAAEVLEKNGAGNIYAAVSHCSLNDLGRERLKNSPIKELITTDSIPIRETLGGKIKVLSVAPLLGEAIKRIHMGRSVSSLFKMQI
ncbi:MAG: ribose-phosphate pyrophosphokinase [Verrucomicrobiota bacterium]|nr:ribose-phosphate pyrophosphokinase [Verrucomicrobiota bacterium]